MVSRTLPRRIEAAEDRRGAPRVEFPDQELEQIDGSWVLRIEPRRETEDHNAALSLATNLAVANALLEVGTGLFRVMAEPTERQIERLRHTATAFGLRWPHNQSLADFRRTLHRGDPAANGFLLAVRRAGGGASYEELDDDSDDRPWHSAIAAPYVHATAPLRRLADRYVVDAGLAVGCGEPIPEHVRTAFGELPRVMARAEGLAHRAENAVIALAEAVMLAGREQEVFDAVVVDEDHRGTVIQLVEPAVLAHVTAHHVAPGDADAGPPRHCRHPRPDRRVQPRQLSGSSVLERRDPGRCSGWIETVDRAGERQDVDLAVRTIDNRRRALHVAELHRAPGLEVSTLAEHLLGDDPSRAEVRVHVPTVQR